MRLWWLYFVVTQQQPVTWNISSNLIHIGGKNPTSLHLLNAQGPGSSLLLLEHLLVSAENLKSNYILHFGPGSGIVSVATALMENLVLVAGDDAFLSQIRELSALNGGLSTLKLKLWNFTNNSHVLVREPGRKPDYLLCPDLSEDVYERFLTTAMELCSRQTTVLLSYSPSLAVLAENRGFQVSSSPDLRFLKLSSPNAPFVEFELVQPTIFFNWSLKGNALSVPIELVHWEQVGRPSREPGPRFVGHDFIRYPFSEMLWDSSFVFLALLSSLDPDPTSVVVELGAGTGLVSLATTHLVSHVIATDHPDHVSSLTSNWKRNGSPQNMHIAGYRWGDDPSALLALAGRFPDYIFCSDVAYKNSDSTLLIESLRLLSSQQTRILVVFPIRDNFAYEHFSSLVAHSFSLERMDPSPYLNSIPASRRNHDWFVATLRRSDERPSPGWVSSSDIL